MASRTAARVISLRVSSLIAGEGASSRIFCRRRCRQYENNRIESDQRWQKNRRRGPRAPISVGADKAYDTRDFVKTLRDMGIRPHVAQNLKRSGGSAIDQRTARHNGYQISQRKRPLIEKAFGWMKQTGGIRKTKLRGLWKVGWQFLMTAAAFNLWRLPKLQTAKV